MKTVYPSFMPDKYAPEVIKNVSQGTKIFQYCTCPAGRVTYKFHLQTDACVLVCNKEHKGVLCNMTYLSNSSRSTRPTGRVLWEELLIISRFHL